MPPVTAVLVILQSFLAWWGRQLLAVVPPSWISKGEDLSVAILLTTMSAPKGEPALVEVSDLREGSRTSLGQFTLNVAGLDRLRGVLGPAKTSKPVVLEVHPDQVLEKTLSLPIVAERDLGRILFYEMDRETPFSAEEVFWSFSISGRDRILNRLEACITIIPRTRLAALIEALAGIDLSPAAVAAPQADSGWRIIPLADGQFRNRFWPHKMKLSSLALALLGSIALILPIVRDARALASLENRILDLQSQVEEVRALRVKIGAPEEEAIRAERARIAEPLRVLAALTTALPDDAYLTSFSLKARRVSIEGEGSGAAHLLSVLANDPSFEDPVFAAPVVKAEASAAEMFSIAAEVR